MSPSMAWGILRIGGATYNLAESVTTIGRDPSTCNLVLSDASVSRQHARLYYHAGTVEVENLSATNPTRLRGQPIGGRATWRSGDVIEIGDLCAQLQILGANCLHCGQPTRAHAQFCPLCGKPQTRTLAPGTHPRTQFALGQRRLVVQFPSQAAAIEYSLDKPVHFLGRASNNDILIPHLLVSANHARIELAGSDYQIVDLGSTNGLLLNGRKVPQHVLGNQDVIRIGDAFGNSVMLTYLDESAPRALQRLNLSQPHTLIGRDPQATIPLNAPTISWHHAEVDWDGSTHTLADLNSTNGTFVNGARVKKRVLQPGDVVQIGPYQLTYDRAGLTQFNVSGNVRLDALDLTRAVRVKNGTRLILNHVSLSIQPREFVALVGASGAGKSTLMGALSGFARAQGTVLLNGADFYRDFEAYRAMLGFVPQQDIIHRGLPVESALRYAAQLRLPPDWTRAQIEQRIVEVMRAVEIEAQRAQMVNRLSGGQLKRVSIAVELLAQPALFFLDEPTSGLDPGLEKKMMYNLRQLADEGQTIVLVTHATANIDQCSRVAFMAAGRLVYYGAPADAKTFFGKQDFSDIYTELGRVDDPKNPDQVPASWEQQFKQSAQYQQNIAQPLQHAGRSPGASPAAKSLGARTSPVRQWWILTRRYLELILRDKGTLFILLAVMPLIGFLVLIIANAKDLVGEPVAEIAKLHNYARFGDAQKLLFILSLAAALLGIFASAYEIVREQHIFKRERMVGLGVLPYVFSKIGVLFLFSLIQSFFFLVVIGFKVTLPEQGAFLPGPIEMYITLVLATLASIGLGLLISSLARTENMVIYVILLVLFIQILFAGAIFDLPKAAQPLSYLTVTHWTMDSLGSTADLRTIRDAEKMNDLPLPKKELGINYGHTAKHLLSRWFVLGAFAVTLTALTCVRQKKKDEL